MIAIAGRGLARGDDPPDGPKLIFKDEYIDNLVGEWKLTRKIRGREVVNKVRAEWVKDRSTTFRIKLLPELFPKGADLDMDGTIGIGIYKLDGDTLTIAHTEAGQDRPKL